MLCYSLRENPRPTSTARGSAILEGTLYSAALTKFDGHARGDDVMGNVTVSKLRASQVSLLRRFIKPAPVY